MIGQKIRKLRQDMGMTQEELAHKMGYKSKSTINKIEHDVHDVNQTTLIKFSQVLGVEPNYFIEDIEHDATPDIMQWVKRLLALPPDALDNAIKYIEFLENRS